MSYNIMKKRAGFAGSTEGTIENIVDTHTDQTINGSKSFSNTVTSSADVMLSGSGKISASFFYGDGSGLSGVSSGGAAGQGPVESIQFHTGSGGLSGSANLTFLTSSNTLEVTGDISASVNISASSFYGDGSNLTDIAAANISGQLSPTQIAHSSPLTNSGGTLDVKIVSNSGIIDSSGLKLGIDSMNVAPYNDTYFVAVSDGSDNPYKIQFSTIESSINIDGGNITGSNSINNAVLPSTINQSVISASTGISGAFFEGDGSGLTGVTASPTPAGSNTQIQFNDNGSLAGDADLTFLTGSDTLATTNVSASSNISGSSLYLDQEIIVGGQTFLDVEGDVLGGNASFIEITASSTISSSGDVYGENFRGNGSTLNNVPLGSSNASSVVFIDNYNNQTITTNADFKFDGTDVLNNGGGFKGVNLSASADLEVGGHITGSGDLKLLNGDLYLAGTSRIFFDGDDGTIDVFMTERAGGNGIIIDGKNRIRFKADQYVIFEAPDSTEPILIDFNSSPYQLELLMALSSSQAISASALHLQDGITNAGETIFNSQGNIVGTSATAVITIADNPTIGDTISFGDSTITPVVVSTYQTRASGDDITIGVSAAATRTNTKNKLESLHNVSVTINGDDLEITNNNLGLIGNRTISETFTSVNNSVSGFTGGYSIDIYANDITASSFSSPDGTLISAEGNFEGNNASFNEITASSVISSSAEISASSFHGDGSNLQNVSAMPQYRYQYINSVVKMNTNLVTANSFQLFPADADGIAQSSDRTTHFVMPGSGSIERVIMSPSFYNTNGSGANVFTTSHSPQFFVRKNDISDGTPISGIALQMTASSANMKPLDLSNNAGTLNTQVVIFDVADNNPVITGSNSFDPGDVLIFSGRNDVVVSDVAITIVLKIEEAGVAYP